MKTTNRHFRIFDREVRRLWKLWGITGFELETRLSHEGELPPEAKAGACPFADQRRIIIVLNRELDDTPDKVLRGYARHECIHALLQPLGRLACDRFVSNETLDAAEHEVLVRLERLLPA